MKKGILFAVLAVLMLGVVACSNQDEKKSINSPATSKSVSSSMKKDNKNETISGTTAGMKTAFAISFHPNYIEAVSSIYKMYQAADVVLVGKFEKDNKSFVDHDLIETESHMKITKLLKGTLTDSEMKNGIDIVYYGGEVTLDTYLNNTPPAPDKVDSNGILHKQKQYSKQERESQKVVFKPEQQANKDKDKNSEIMVFLSRNPAPNNYFVMGDAFGYRKINNKGEVFNPITNSYEKVNFYSTN
ncbi:hypothetical protein [Ectobacillus panaciterrae]|uniref:hypothetical protein n=1 Tax=Ectobacillus panaciterrae TaxID=363872 RepID=UPI0004094EFC|nr:hypothetical protein [Ectobacillus panaciterrae]